MSDATPRLALPLIAAAQAQKHVTHNEALTVLDAVVQLSVADRLSAPPPSPAADARYLVAAAPTGDFAGHAGALAVHQDGAWRFVAPREGWIAYVEAEDAALVYRSGGWEDLKPRSADRLGIGATADAGNRLAVASPAVLFTHAGDDSRVKIDKAAAGDTASLLFQTGFSGRAEIGLAGGDDLALKVSPDGAAWTDAMAVDRATGRPRFPQGVAHAATGAVLGSLIFTPGGDGEVSILRLDRSRAQDPRTATLSAVSGATLTLSTNDADLFFTYRMRNVSRVRIWNTSKTPPAAAWVEWDPAVNQLRVTDAAHVAGWLAGETIRLGDIAGEPGVPAGFTRGYALDIAPMLQNRLGAVFPQKGLMFKCSVVGIGGVAGIVASPTAVSGSFFGGNSLSNGAQNNTMHVVPTTELSPISNSNLVYVREDAAGGATLGLATFGVCGVWA